MIEGQIQCQSQSLLNFQGTEYIAENKRILHFWKQCSWSISVFLKVSTAYNKGVRGSKREVRFNQIFLKQFYCKFEQLK